MKKQYIIFGIVIVVLAAALVFVFTMLQQQKSENAELQVLAELDKLEMEDQYRQFDIQYGELQKQLKNDSLIAQIEEERRHTQELLEELERTKATDAAEITRLKKEITSLRKVLQSYIMQVASLNRLNETLVAENEEMKEQVTVANTQISSLRTQASTLKDKVEIAAQLDATGFWVSPKNKRSKDETKAKNVKKVAFGFTIVKNVTAQNGERVIYARILKPDNTILGGKGTFSYENTQLEYTEKKYIDYNGEEQTVTMYSDIEEFIDGGTYKVFIFCDKQMIGQTSFTLK